MSDSISYQIMPAMPEVALPDALLQLADPNPLLIQAYLPLSQIYLLMIEQQAQGISVLQVRESTAEVMNLAIDPAHQGKGLGKALLGYTVQMARQQGLKHVLIKTGNSSIGQIALYQQFGFELTQVQYDHFLNRYDQPIWENRIQCKHQLVFQLSL